jgi:ABC-type glycerol-3-phosphate transport system substrate-binding protein
VTLLGAEGRLGSAVKGRPHVAAAWEFLLWLSGPRWSERAAGSSRGTTLFRASHLRSPGAWVDQMRPTAARSYARTLQASLTQRPVMLAPRLPGADRYLAALDRAVRAAVSGEHPPRAALKAAADEWRQITRELGLASQKRAYHASLGLPAGVE